MGTTIVSSATSTCAPCGTASATALERTRFFPGQLIGPDDLTQDQIYFREKLRRHNRMIHGWGVACGVGVTMGQTSCQLIVGPGYILGPFGDEIVIDQSTTFDVCQQSAGQPTGCCGQELDPWCADVRANCNAGTLYLAVRYQECQARPVQTGSCGCGCSDATCQYSRIRDSFTLAVLDALPPGYTTPMALPPLGSLTACTAGPNGPVGRACPPCPTSPWVIIADLTVGSDCTIQGIDCFAHRRYVLSWGNDYQLCTLALYVPPPAPAPAPIAGKATPAIVDVSAGAAAQPRATVALTRPDGTSAVIPANFAVRSGETLATLLSREGSRQFQDPTTDTTFTLGDLYADAGVSPSTTLANTGSALGLLEGHTLDIAGLRAGQAALAGLLQPAGLTQLDTDMGGAPSLAPMLPASALAAAGSDQAQLAKLGKRTIAAVAATPRDAFVDSMLKSVAAAKRTANRVWSGALWDAATEVSNAATAVA